MIEHYELTGREDGNDLISAMCRWSRVSRSGYYSWRDRPQSRRDIRRQELVALIEDELKASDSTYGYRRIAAVAARRVVRADPGTVRSIMRQPGLVAARARRGTRTTVLAADLEGWAGSGGAGPRRHDTRRQAGRGCHLCSYLVGFVYLATAGDCATRKIVGYAMADHTRTDDMAVRSCPPAGGTTIFHSDGARSTPPRSSPSTWAPMAFACRRAGPGCAGTTPGRSPSVPRSRTRGRTPHGAGP